MRPLYIFDIDGTLANSQHRLKHLDAKNYDTYYGDLVYEDEPIVPVIDTMHRLKNAGADIWFFSGRNERCRLNTQHWLERKAWVFWFEDQHLVMRKREDHRDDVEVKQEMLDNMLKVDRQRLVAVFDDRNRVVDMWRRNNIQCFQVAPGDF